ncbi:probable salivary secreted peptide [Drosophila sulfurigaster albostrigata]|uniref:Probable salivary secreted peptide n=1 Tax=Drosophila albomicans TaxID=7291 RepID=A0A6P8XAM4_DROAB|nr:probable salivary secreted peptide [Drosophila albomicans]XP_062134376.1 probable salivary secreted peptide [Drosophila sulfurigaster albostrigata]
MKFLYCAVLILAVFAASHAYSASWGKRNNTDYLLSRQIVVRNPIKNNYISVNVDYPGNGVGYYNISLVSVIDNFRNTSGATPSLWSGGPGFKFAQVNLRSVVSQGINSTVEIYGR